MRKYSLMGVAVLFAAIVVPIAGCGHLNSPSTILVIDHWWDSDYAKGLCESAQSNSIQFGTTPCIDTPEGMTSDVETGIISALRENPKCSNISISMTFPSDQRNHWMLMVDFALEHGDISPKESSWTMTAPTGKGTDITEGYLGDYFEAATRICTIIKGGGATESTRGYVNGSH